MRNTLKNKVQNFHYQNLKPDMVLLPFPSLRHVFYINFGVFLTKC